MRYAVVFEHAATNWCAYVPDLPGFVTTGQTLEETRRLIGEEIHFHIEELRLPGIDRPRAEQRRGNRRGRRLTCPSLPSYRPLGRGVK
jgi:predicted RNase H-like HicB family nuclease